MAQKITIRILERQFPLTVESPVQEKRIRDAAEKVDEKYYEIARQYPGRSTDEILSFVALNAFVETAEMKEKMESWRKEAERLDAGLKGYLKNIDTENSR